MGIEENIQRIADALETIAKWDQMQIDWLTEQKTKISAVPVESQAAEKPKAKTFGKAKKIEQDIEDAEEDMTDSNPPWDVDEDEKASRTTVKPPKKKAPPKKKPIEDDDDFFDEEEEEEDEPPARPVKKSAKKPVKKAPVIDDDDDDDFDI